MKNLLKVVVIMLLSMTVVLGSCKKEESVDPPPAAYIPSFSATYFSAGVIGGIEVIDVYITCTSDDWEMIKVDVKGPGGGFDKLYSGNGALQLRGEPFTFTDYFPKLGGSWSFNITGNVKSGEHLGTSFVTSTQLNISGK